MKCDFDSCDKKVVLISGYHYCAEHARGRDRIAIHNIIQDAFPTITLEKIKQMCCEMFETTDYGFSTFSKLYKIKDRGLLLKNGPRVGWYAKPLESYLIETFEVYLRTNHEIFWNRVKNDRIVRFYDI